MDLRDVRGSFYDKKLAYACSYDPELCLDLREAIARPNGLRVPMKQRLDQQGSNTFGSVFHVLDAASVTGVDGRKHNCPIGQIEYVEESIVFRYDGPIGEIEGRMNLTTTDGATIEATYSGIVRFPGLPTAFLTNSPNESLTLHDLLPTLFSAATEHTVSKHSPPREEVYRLEGKVWLVPTFLTTDSRYRWLGEHACVAFGTWVAEKRLKPTILHNVTMCLDVYSAG